MPGETRDTQTMILDAALVEVLAHGVRRTSATDIARRSGVSRQTIYRYWPDAQAVFATLITRELLATLPGRQPLRSLDELVAVLTATADAIRRLPIVARLRDTDPELFSRYILQRLGTSQHAILDEISARLRSAQSEGFVRDQDPGRLAAMVLLITQSAIQSAPLVAAWLSPLAWRDELSRALVGYLRTDAA